MFAAKTLGQTSPLLGAMRLFNALSPCIYNSTTTVSKLLHGTWLGRLIVGAYWKTLTSILWRKHGLSTSENGRKLTPNLGELGYIPYPFASPPSSRLVLIYADQPILVGLDSHRRDISAGLLGVCACRKLPHYRPPRYNNLHIGLYHQPFERSSSRLASACLVYRLDAQ